MEYALLIASVFGVILVCALTAAAVFLRLHHRDYLEPETAIQPVLPGSGPPQMIHETNVREIRKPQVDTSYDPLAGLPETDPEKRETERRTRLKELVGDTQSPQLQFESEAPGPIIPSKPQPDAATNAAHRQTRLKALIRDTQSGQN